MIILPQCNIRGETDTSLSLFFLNLKNGENVHRSLLDFQTDNQNKMKNGKNYFFNFALKMLINWLLNCCKIT